MNIKEFILLAIQYENVDSVLDLFPEQSQKGFIFERLFDICIKFGLFDIFNLLNTSLEISITENRKN